MVLQTKPMTVDEFSAHHITFAVHQFCRENKIECHTSGFGGPYDIQGNVIAPNFAFKRALMSDDFPDPVAPEWAIEVVSFRDRATDTRAKRQIYIQAGILYGELYPKLQSIDVYAPGQPPRTLGINDTLDGGDVLPGFTLAMKALFK
jgi:Uma2 family endonuclease